MTEACLLVGVYGPEAVMRCEKLCETRLTASSDGSTSCFQLGTKQNFSADR